MSYIIYGWVTCRATKKTISWFKKHKLSFEFHNNKTEPLTKEKLEDWCSQVGWEKLLNKRGTAFKHLHPAVQLVATTEKQAIEIMELRPSTIKRPIIEKNNKIISIGFNEIQFNIQYL